MKKTLLILGTMCTGLILSAQSGIITTRPANDPAGKILTMEETTLSRELSPKNLYASWKGNDSLLVYIDGKWKVQSVV